jgi:singapore isolate B (sub-type 7) whole genome shotgun sequence assembly, scaffold_0
VFIPKISAVEEEEYAFSSRDRKQGIRLLLVVGRDGKLFNMHVSESGRESSCTVFNESALGYTLRFHKRSILNRILEVRM